MKWNKIWMIMGVGLFVLGYALAEDLRIFVSEGPRLYSQLTKEQKEEEISKKDLTSFQKEVLQDIANLKKEDSLLRSYFIQRLEIIQSQLNTIRKERETIRKDVTDLQRAVKRDISNLQSENTLLRNEILTEIKKLQADLILRYETLQSEIRSLTAESNEYREFFKRSAKEIDRIKDEVSLKLKALEERGKTFEQKNKTHEDRTKTLEERIKGIEEDFKKINENIGRVASKQIELEKMIPPKEVPIEEKRPPVGAGDLYKDAYETFLKGDLEGARRKFETFLKLFPNNELSDNAQFWIGETYYLKKDFEKAILEYEKLIAKYPEGDKMPDAMFKQGLAFLELGDKANARNLLKWVIERYPQSDQAEMAKKRLEKIK